MKHVKLAALLVSLAAAASSAGELENAVSFNAASLSAAFAGLKANIKAQAEDPATARQKMLDEKLLSAVSSANVGEIRRLAAMGANVNAYDNYHFTPLSQAMQSHGDPDTVNALLELGAKVDLKGTCDYTALHEAAANGRLEGAQILVAHHATIDAKACLGDTPLLEAAANGKSDVFQYLLGLGADPNAAGYQGKTAVIHAANLWVQPKDNAILASLLADPRTNINAHDDDGMTALKIAAKGNNLELVKLLLTAPKIDVNDNSGGTTALFLAELDKFDDVAAALRAAGGKGLLANR